MAAPARTLRQCRWPTGALLQPLLLLAIVVGLSAACLGNVHAHGTGNQAASAEPAVVTSVQGASQAPAAANGASVLPEALLAAGEGHGHPEATCHGPLSATLRQSSVAATADLVGLVMAAAPPTAWSDAIQSWTAQASEHGTRSSAGRDLLDLLCVSRS